MRGTLPVAVREWKQIPMEAQTFISIGTKGTSLPLGLTEISPPLTLGVNVLRWAGRGKLPEAEKAHGWVSKNGEPFEVYPLTQAIEQGRVRHFPRVAWVGHEDDRKHAGEAFFPDWWHPGDAQPLLVAVRSETWRHGCVERTLIRDGRNRDSVARLDLDSLEAAAVSPATKQESAATAANWADAELSAAVTAYLELFAHEEAGRRYNKAEYIRRLHAGPLNARTPPAIEYRMADISKALAEAGLPWIQGYKPLTDVGSDVQQRLLRLLAELETGYRLVSRPAVEEREVRRRTNVLLRAVSLSKPAGTEKPVVVERTINQYARSPDIQAFVLRQAAGHCELCEKAAPFVDKDGIPFLEVHHVVPLADAGPDTVENAAALCPNCHRRLHHSGDREKKLAQLYTRVDRLRRPPQQEDEEG